MKPRKFQEINKTKYVGFICLVTLGLSWNHINVISIVIWWTMDSRCPVWPLCRRWVWSQGNGWRLFLGWAEAMDFWMIVDGISIVYLWYIYGISCCTKKSTHMLKLDLRWLCFAGLIIYLSISLGLSTRGLYATVCKCQWGKCAWTMTFWWVLYSFFRPTH